MTDQPRKLQLARGQAMAEMVLTIPLLFLLAAGMFQFTQLFLARVHFERACETAMREWIVGLRVENAIKGCIWDALGPDQRLFLQGSLGVSVSGTRSGLSDLQKADHGTSGMFGRGFQGVLFDYRGTCWTVRVRCRPVPLFSWLFKEGVPLTTRLAALRHPVHPGCSR